MVAINQLSFFTHESTPLVNLRAIYEGDNTTSALARLELERNYQSILQPTDQFTRQLVSFQANKSARMHRWFKYKEGFSAQLVRNLIREFKLQPKQHLLDPFAGVSTTLLVAREFGLHATGIEVMPIGEIVWKAKSRLNEYDLDELQSVRDWVKTTKPQLSDCPFPHLPITRHAFSVEHEAQLMWYDEQFQRFDVADNVKVLLKFLLLSILEDISYTSKDGQFLRWDSRSLKVKTRNAKRLAEGKKQFKPFRKGRILGLQEAIAHALDLIVQDVSLAVTNSGNAGDQEFMQGTVLESLPMQMADSYDAVITSPPYCNRYDYTRTYALELAFLGIDQKDMLNLRQRLLSATVENRSKLKNLENYYNMLGRQGDFEHIVSELENLRAFQEILSALRLRSQLGQVNNSGVITMVEGYFIELAFVTFELFRVCKRGARVAIVNDNVRYSGEVIPVDLLMTDIAARFGFTPEKVYVLPQRKGNSSQQMGKYGREALRKSILIWSKPGKPNAV